MLKCQHFNIYEQDKFRAQLSFITLDNGSIVFDTDGIPEIIIKKLILKISAADKKACKIPRRHRINAFWCP